MYKSVLLPQAKRDIREAALWYNQRSKGLGKKFMAEIRKKIRFILGNPTASPIRYDDVRTAVLNVFPYMVHYTVDEANKTVIISAVLHTSRDTKMWKTR